MVTDQDIWNALANAPNCDRCTVWGKFVSENLKEPRVYRIMNISRDGAGTGSTYVRQIFFDYIRMAISYGV